MSPENAARRLGFNPVRRAIILIPQRDYRSGALSASATRLDDSAFTDARELCIRGSRKEQTSPRRFDAAPRQAAEVCLTPEQEATLAPLVRSASAKPQLRARGFASRRNSLSGPRIISKATDG
jgi:hypothetical protein